MKWIQKHHVILIIMAVATVLRFWKWPFLHYHHDELSALLRTRFTTFEALINKGVAIDGHPALTQFFLWVYSGLVGYEPMWIKLPFILVSVVSVLMVFLIAKELFNRRSANVAAAMMAVLQYGLIYAQWARPYAFGLFFLLVATYCLLAFRNKAKRLYLIGFMVSAALTAYSHYFALLQLLIVTTFVFILLNRRQRLELIVASLAAFLLFTPHLNITFHHLQIGGIGEWLKQPPTDFWLELLKFSFHYSWWLVLPILAAFFISWFKFGRSKSRLGIQIGLIACWVIPYGITYYYSVHVSSLMHHGTMYFTFPMLVLFAASYFDRLNNGFAKFAASWIMVLGTITLVNDRHHYELNTVTEFHDPIQWYQNMSFSGEADVTALFDLREDAVHLLHTKGIENYDNVRLIDPIWKSKQLGRYLNQVESQLLLITVTPGSEPEYLALAMHYFPIVEELHCYQTSSCYLLRKSDHVEPENVLGSLVTYQSMEGKEYTPALHIELNAKTGWNTLILGAELQGQLPTGAKLVMDWKKNDSTLFWRGVDIDRFQTVGVDQTSFACASIDLRDLGDDLDDGQLSTFIWNSGRKGFLVKRLTARRSVSNPLRYGLFNSIPGDNSLQFDHGIAKKLFYFERD